MTEAMSRRDIEDVLTSIKRLVSQEAQSRPNPEPALARTGKLILTPALRVAPEAESAAPATPIAANDPAPTEPLAPTPPAEAPAAEAGTPASYSLIRRISEAGAIPPAQPDLAPEGDAFDAFSGAEPDQAMEGLEDSALEATLARLEAVLSGKPVPPAESAEATETPDATTPEGEQIIDEGMLYQLVAHIVRQELQGELGEKITRNIRKLVRQEVARELQLRRS
ncbi:hypothetical protein [Natronohydrobacter thiooxidans]|uniref:hypothetical protein n=1 Tax=Natronohydrobacter thiooxidans TaxID=87172 RepID=UPI0008FF12D4|nr:hypothetical protein [Natronohydrobacter thiooxidans]